jgi:hypothetical protein
VRRISACFLVLLMIGGSSCLVQVLGWTVMVAQRAPQVGFFVAVGSVLAGERPCGFCQAASALRAGETGLPDTAVVTLKKQPDAVPPRVVIHAPSGRADERPRPEARLVAISRVIVPDVPPPRITGS